MVSSGDGGKIEQGVGADAGRGNVKKLEEDSEVAELAREEEDDDEKKEDQHRPGTPDFLAGLAQHRLDTLTQDSWRLES